VTERLDAEDGCPDRARSQVGASVRGSVSSR
jgi:hypothetical protein